MKKLFKHGWRDLFLLAFSVGLLLVGVFFVWAASLKIPDVTSLVERKITQSAKIYDRTGEILLYDLHENIDRTIVPIQDMSRHIKNATVAIEDAEFYDHNGIKPTSILRAVLVNLRIIPGIIGQGGSTITQQVVKNSVLTNDKTISRKLKEWVLAIKLEQVLLKESILELYLNEIPYGGTIYGVEEAAQAFYGKSAREVTLAEAAYLAAVPQAPTYYSPYGNRRDTALEERKNLVLSRMLELDFITESEYEEAKNATVEFQPQQVSGIRAPHFVFFVREQLEQEYGRRVLEESGWHIITSIDMELQETGERILKEYALKNVEDFHAENAGLVAIDPKTGDILTMVGSRDYFDEEIDGNFNIALANRQPGSAFKPFVYAQALREGYTPDTVVFDVQTQFSTTCPASNLTSDNGCYSPGNYDFVYRGPTTLRDALAQSINIPAVKALYLVGISDALRLARTMGITTLIDPARYGLTLVLGGGEVSLLDITSAYSVFASGGVKHDYRAVIRIEDRDGELIHDYPVSENRIMEENIAYTISDMLSDNVARTPAFGANSPLYFSNYHVASKTGTTNDSRDAWIVGYSPNLAVGTWAGNNNNTPMVKQVAGFIVAPMWRAFMDEALTKFPNDPFPEPRALADENDKPVLRGIWEGSDITKVDLFGNPISENYVGETKEKVVLDIHSILYWLDKNNPRGPRPANPEQDSQFSRWEYSVQAWKAANGFQDGQVIFR